MKEGDPKLTEAKLKLYAESRRNMPDSPEIPGPQEHEKLVPNMERTIELARRLEGKERVEGKKGAVETSIPKATEFMEHMRELHRRGEDGREIEQALEFMLGALNETTIDIPLRQWSDERLASIYQEFQEYNEDLKEEVAKGGSREEVSRNHDMLGMVSGIKEMLADAADDKDGVITGSVLEKREKELAEVKKITNRKIRERIELIAERLDNGKISTRAEILAARRELKDFVDAQGKLDKDTKEVVGKMSNYLSGLLDKSGTARKVEQPQTTITARGDTISEPDHEGREATGSERSEGGEASEAERQPENRDERELEEPEDEETSGEIKNLLNKEKKNGHLSAVERRKLQEYRQEQREQKRKEDGRREVERGIDEELAKRAEQGKTPKTAQERESMIKAALHVRTAEQTDARANYLQKRREDNAKAEAQKTAAEKEEARLEKQLNRQWKEKKKTFAKIADQAAEIRVESNWREYDWTKEQKEEIARAFDLNSLEKAKPILVGYLLQGKTGAEALEEVKAYGKNTGRLFADRFLHDFDAGRALGLSPTEIDDLREERFDSGRGSNPTNMQELAWQISTRDPKQFGENGEHPVWERRVRKISVDEEGRTIMKNDPDFKNGYVFNARGEKVDPEGESRVKFETHQVVNEDNFMLWFRERVNFWQNQGPNERYNFYEQIKLQKSLSALSLSRMLENEATMFTGSGDERISDELLPDEWRGQKSIKEDYTELSEMLQVEAFVVTMVRQFHLAYDENKGSEEEMFKQIQQLYDKNHMTKSVWGGKPLWQFLTILPEKFSTLDSLDGGVGASVVKSLLAYYHISDYEKLVQVLGKEVVDANGRVMYDISHSKLFSAEGLREARDAVKVRQEAYGDIHNPDKDVFDFSYKYDENGNITGFNNSAVNDAFKIVEVYRDNEGKLQARTKVKNPRAFISLINIFREYTNSTDMEAMVDHIIKEESSGAEKLDPINKSYAQLIAKHLTRFTGAAAENDTEFSGYDAFTRMGHLRGYRDKTLSGKLDEDGNLKNRGGDAGNPNTIAQFKRLVVNPLLGIVTVNNKPILRVLHELHAIRQRMDRELEEIPYKAANDEEEKQMIAEEKDAATQEYREKAREMRFRKNAEQHYLRNHFERGMSLYAIVRGGKGINLHDFGGYNPEIGFYFKREQFQQEIVKKLITTARYAFQTYGSLNYNMIIRGFDYDMTFRDENGKILKDKAGNVIKGGWRDMPLGEAMFGHQMLDREEFWDKRKRDKDGNIVRDENGKAVEGGWVYQRDGKHKIDWDKVQKNQGLLFKQWILTYFAGEFIAYRQYRKWSTDPRNEFWWYEDIINALGKIPGNWEGTENDMNDINISEFFFDKKSIDWLRKVSGTTKANVYGMAALRSLLLGKMGSKDESVWGGFGEAFQRFMAAIGSGH